MSADRTPARPTTESMRLEEVARIYAALSALMEERVGIDLWSLVDGWQDHVAGLTPAEAADYLTDNLTDWI
jgi:hypothetical protein